MAGLHPTVDPDGLLEFSVVYTDRALNHMSQRFQGVMRSLHASLTSTYHAASAVIVPGSGTFGMEAVARQFANQQSVLVVRNGWFSYRWTQILEAGGIASHSTVCMARPQSDDAQAAWTPCPIDEVTQAIRTQRPAVVFAPHVETSAGMLLPNDYLSQLAQATHEVGGLLVLDCIASGALWVNMQALGVDVLITAPQKGWSASPACAMVMLSERALQTLENTNSSSFACDLKRWHGIMQAYLNGGHAYHTTMPTDALVTLNQTMDEMHAYGYAKVQDEQWALGHMVRELLAEHGFASVAAVGYEAPGVVVCHTTDPDLHNGKKFMQAGLQTAAGVPLQCQEPASFRTFRIGLFGLDKLHQPQRAVAQLAAALDSIGYPAAHATTV